VTLDLDGYLALPRLSSLVASSDGRLAVHQALPDREGTRFATTVLALDEAGPRPLTGARTGLGAAAYTPDGDLLLVDRRPDPFADPEKDDDDVAALWELPAAGGEARYLVGTPAGVDGVHVARAAGTVVVTSAAFRTAADLDADRTLARARKDAGTAALWFDGYPVRLWDTHLGPRAPRLFVLDRDSSTLRDLTGNCGWALREAELDVTPDGRSVVTTWEVPRAGGARYRDVAIIDVATGERGTLLHDPDVDHGELACSPDGRYVAVCRQPVVSPERAARTELWLVPLDGDPNTADPNTADPNTADPNTAGAAARRLAPDFEHWPRDLEWTPDSAALLFVADECGRAPLWRLELAPGAAPVRLSADGAFSDVRAGDGVVHALRSRIATPPEVVALDPHRPDQEPRVVHAVAQPEPWPGRVEELHTVAEDGTPLRAWLVLPDAATEPSPLVVAVHGGPLSSWNAWHWRWQPQLLAARGYAVLLPDPALSTGYGQRMIERGWDQWGGTPYADLLALTDAAVAHADVDTDRTAIAGGSYGGYLTNWVIGHTDRFRCAITHASLWDLSAFRGVTDDTVAWELWWGDPEEAAESYHHWSPCRLAGRIATPTLVIHGEHDYRVPVGEGIALYTELQRRGVPSALLYLPDENHWVQKPGNIRIWYDAVIAWLDHHVRGEPWRRPELL